MERFRSKIGWKCSRWSSKCAILSCWGHSAHRYACFVFRLPGSACHRVLLYSKKVRNFYVFLLCHSSRACSSDYFWTIALSWQEPKRRRCPSKKEQTVWWCSIEGRRTEICWKHCTPMVWQSAQSKMVLTTKSLPTLLSCRNYSNSIRTWPFWLYSSDVVSLVSPRVSVNCNSAKN